MTQTPADKMEDYAAIRDRLLGDNIPLKELWTNTTSRRRIGLMFAHVRKNAGLTQAEVASRTGWDEEFIIGLEGALSAFPESGTYLHFVEACGAKAALVIFQTVDDKHVHVIDAIPLQTDLDEDDLFERLRDQDIEIA